MSVVDASLMVRVLTANRTDEPIRRRLADPTDPLHAPDHVDIEVLSAISGLLKGGRIDHDRAKLMSDQFTRIEISRHSDLAMASRIISLRHNFTAYDAAYVALAEILDQPLLTVDAKFARAPSTTHRARIETY